MDEKARILIVDDNVNLCRTMSLILSRKGHSVTTAKDGAAAIEQLEQSPVDIVFMDIKMPVMDGVETYKRIKQIRPETIAIMMTAYAVEDLIQDALMEGAFAVIYKPLDMEKVISLIEEPRSAKDGVFIMVVDDEPGTCTTLRNILTRRDYKVAIADSGEGAIELAKEQTFDILLIDMKLPAINGLETYLSIKEINPEAIAIMITGYRQEMNDLVEEAINNSAYACLYKPLDMETLLGLIDRILKLK